MSIIHCKNCEKDIDTDFNAEHFDEFCDNCGCVLNEKETESCGTECDNFCPDCYENEINGMKFG